MAEKTMTVTLREDIGQRLQAFADERRQTIDEVLETLLPAPSSGENWALAFADEMEAADIDWTPDPEALARQQARREGRDVSRPVTSPDQDA
jgi:hypothetical protein